jgi:hypothetical protein
MKDLCRCSVGARTGKPFLIIAEDIEAKPSRPGGEQDPRQLHCAAVGAGLRRSPQGDVEDVATHRRRVINEELGIKLET